LPERRNASIITLSNRERVSGVLVGEDPLTDIAVLKLDLREGQHAPAPVTLGDSDALVVGQYVMALGSPLALQRSLSFGVVSSKDRFLSDEFKLPTGEKTGSFNTWIQTDAAINPGNSGGPLVNLDGEVVGVNARGAFGASSIGFAIPINIVKEVARSHREGPGLEKLARPHLSAARGACAVLRGGAGRGRRDPSVDFPILPRKGRSARETFSLLTAESASRRSSPRSCLGFTSGSPTRPWERNEAGDRPWE
jgi:S1-C subfamily serine protease